MKKLAVLSHVLPPSPSGQAVVLSRIFSGFSSADFFFIASAGGPEENPGDGSIPESPFRSYRLPAEPNLANPGHSRLISAVNLAALTARILLRAVRIRRILRDDPAAAIAACTGDLIDIPAGFLASRMAGIPFFAYIFDDYVYQWTGLARRFARIVSTPVFRHSRGVICPNEFLCEEYRRRYGVTTTLIHNPCSAGEDAGSVRSWPREAGRLRIVYTGAVYQANYDCFQNLLRAVGMLPETSVEVHIYTAQTTEQLASQGIAGPAIFVHNHAPYRDVLERQRDADILFLPLAFESPIPEVIRTSAPGKMGEYLSSGRPVLVHAPADSYLCWYFRRHRCGVAVDEDDPACLADGLRGLIQEADLRNLSIANARECARSDFDPETARARMRNLVEL
jgi:glycosyltransferase involved in cell wall biosynthesis